MKVLPEAAVAVRVTVVVSVNEREHVVPQLIPFGDDFTVPEPVPVFVTVNAYEAADTFSAGTTTKDSDTTMIAEINPRKRATVSFLPKGC